MSNIENVYKKQLLFQLKRRTLAYVNNSVLGEKIVKRGLLIKYNKEVIKNKF